MDDARDVIPFDEPLPHLSKNQLYWAMMRCQSGLCFVCQLPEWQIGSTLQLHRIVPGSRGGKYTLDNVMLACRTCHPKIEGMNEEEVCDYCELVYPGRDSASIPTPSGMVQ